MFNRPLNSFVPTFYKDVVEMEDIMNSEEHIMDIARREVSAAFANTFVLTSDESGVIMFEKMLGITANSQTEDLEFRRQRVLNRLSMSPPFTFRFLEQKLNEIIGVGAWTAYIDFNNYTLYIESSATDQNWYYEIEFTVNRIKPCNMVFINVPYMAMGVNISETISYLEQSWRYRLSSWKLGAYPFATLDGGGTVKMAETKSIQQALLNDTANFLAEDIAYVVINGTIILEEFRAKQVASNAVTIEYEVTPNLTRLITSIKLMREDATALTQASVYVPVSQSIICKHTMTVKEGI